MHENLFHPEKPFGENRMGRGKLPSTLAHAFAGPQPGLSTYKPIYEGRNLILKLAVVSVVAKMRASADFDLKV